MDGPGGTTKPEGGCPLTAEEHPVAESDLQRQLRRMIDLRGVTHVARELGLAREPVIRYLAGLGVQAGTRELIERRLAECAEPRPSATPARVPSAEAVAKLPARNRRRAPRGGRR